MEQGTCYILFQGPQSLVFCLSPTPCFYQVAGARLRGLAHGCGYTVQISLGLLAAFTVLHLKLLTCSAPQGLHTTI